MEKMKITTKIQTSHSNDKSVSSELVGPSKIIIIITVALCYVVSETTLSNVLS